MTVQLTHDDTNHRTMITIDEDSKGNFWVRKSGKHTFCRTLEEAKSSAEKLCEELGGADKAFVRDLTSFQDR